MIYKDSSQKVDDLLACIHSKFLHTTKNGTVIFHEKAKDAKLKNVSISGFQKVVPIDQDKFTLSPSDNLFNFGNYNKTCDGVFFGIVDSKPIILIFDVKSSRSQTSSNILKMKGGINFANYIKSTLEVFSEVDFSEFECYFCIFHPIYSPSGKTSLMSQPSQDPNKPVYIPVNDGDIVSIRRILGLRLA